MWVAEGYKYEGNSPNLEATFLHCPHTTFSEQYPKYHAYLHCTVYIYYYYNRPSTLFHLALHNLTKHAKTRPRRRYMGGHQHHLPLGTLFPVSRPIHRIPFFDPCSLPPISPQVHYLVIKFEHPFYHPRHPPPHFSTNELQTILDAHHLSSRPNSSTPASHPHTASETLCYALYKPQLRPDIPYGLLRFRDHAANVQSIPTKIIDKCIGERDVVETNEGMCSRHLLTTPCLILGISTFVSTLPLMLPIVIEVS